MKKTKPAESADQEANRLAAEIGQALAVDPKLAASARRRAVQTRANRLTELYPRCSSTTEQKITELRAALEPILALYAK